MEIIKILVFIGLLFSYPTEIFGYSEITTHPALTDQTLKFFEESYPSHLISDRGRDAIVRGSKDEDNNLKWFNHFYDPVYNRGLVIGDDEWPSAKQWGTETKYQKRFVEGTVSGYFSHTEDYSWERAIYDYAWGNETRGLEGLGHVLHLIQDMTVPDHTRNDPHPPVLDFGSPYEAWTQRFRVNNTRISFDTSDSPVEIISISEHFDVIASFSNQNFFSKDTACSQEYTNPSGGKIQTRILSDGYMYTFLVSEDNNHILAGVSASSVWTDILECKFYLNDPDNVILSDYWRVLSKEAVLHGAGVIKLFFDEVEKEKQTKVLFEKNRSWISRKFDEIWGDISNFIFGYDENSNTALIDAVFTEEESVEPTIHRDSIILVSEVKLEGLEEPDSTTTQTTNNFLTDTQPKTSQTTPTTTPEATAQSTSTNNILSPGFGGGIPSVVAAIIPVSEEQQPPQTTGGGSTTEESPTVVPSPEPGAVVINEIGWAGTRASSEDQWVELANNTDAEINLQNISLVAQGRRVSLAGTVQARGFYLLSSHSDAISGVVTDQVVDFGGSLPTAGALLTLEHVSETGATTTLDTTLDCVNWCTQHTASSGVSRERFSSELPGTVPESWGDNNSVVTNGRDRNGAIVFGTPRARNSLDYLVNRDEPILSGTVTLTKAKSPYVIPRGLLSVEQGAQLVIEPGVTIKSLLGGIRVRGSLEIEGTTQDPVRLTSIYDDSVLGDTNGDSGDTVPRAGDWEGLLYEETATDSPLSNAVIRYAGGGRNTGASVYISIVPLTVSHSIIEYGSGTGIFLDRTPSHVHHSTVRFITTSQGQGVGIGISSSDALIENNVISNNGLGITTAGSAHIIRNNQLDNNSGIPLGLVTLIGGSIEGNTGTGNGINAIVLSDRFLALGTTTFGANGLPYFPNSSRLLEGTALIVQPGAVFKLDSTSLEINGSLTLTGSAERPIIFTSTGDDSDGNDARSDGETPLTQRPIRALNISGSGSAQIQNAQFKNVSVGINYENTSPIDLRSVFFKNLTIGVRRENEGAEVVRAENITAENVDFLTDPANLFQNNEN